MAKLIDLTGKKIGRWAVLSRAEMPESNRPYYVCRCECGTERVVFGANLLKGTSKSCGCLHRELAKKCNTTHGMTDSVEHNTWLLIKSRCYNSKNEQFKYWGGRGIKVCDRWLNSFENFYADMGPRPPGKTSIDRIDNDGNYEPGNCRWADWYEQANNKGHSLR